MKKELCQNRVTDLILDIAFKSYGVQNLKTLNISATILMCDCGYSEYAE